MIKVLLADDHQIVTDGLRSILEKETDMQVVGDARNGREVIRLLEKTPADVIVLDIRMPEMDGIETAGIVRERFPAVKILILSMFNEKEYVQRAFEEGVHGYILKEKSKEALVGAVHTVYNGGRYIPPDLVDIVLSFKKKKKEKIHLTERELEVLQLLADGLSAKQIAAGLNIEETTVQTHSRNLRAKFEAPNVMMMVRAAKREGFIDFD